MGNGRFRRWLLLCLHYLSPGSLRLKIANKLMHETLQWYSEHEWIGRRARVTLEECKRLGVDGQIRNYLK